MARVVSRGIGTRKETTGATETLIRGIRRGVKRYFRACIRHLLRIGRIMRGRVRAGPVRASVCRPAPPNFPADNLTLCAVSRAAHFATGGFMPTGTVKSLQRHHGFRIHTARRRLERRVRAHFRCRARGRGSLFENQKISFDLQRAERTQDAAADDRREYSEYRAGVADGAQCLRDGGTIARWRLIAMNDLYSAGFRAGFFLRDR